MTLRELGDAIASESAKRQLDNRKTEGILYGDYHVFFISMHGVITRPATE